MTLATLVGPLAAASGVVMALSPLLQARRIRALGDSSEVSAGVFHTMRMNASIWLTYGLAAGNVVIVVPNVCALVTTTLTLATITRFRGAGHSTPATTPAHAEPAPLRRHTARVRGGVVRASALVRR
ncbi:MAG TPA: SemiSWEET family transporter [Conexibacter sp.]